MAQYKAPLRDLEFVRDELLNATAFFENTEYGLKQIAN